MLEDDPVGLAGETEVSHYDPHSNRCYITLADLNNAPGRYEINRFLYDGQTGEQLVAFSQFGIGKNARFYGGVLMQNWEIVAKEFGIDLINRKWKGLDGQCKNALDDPRFPNALIDAVMTDDRKQ